MLPTEAELCKTYDISRPTIAKALNLLSKEKLVRRRAGFGTQVLAPSKNALTAGLLIPRLHKTEIFEPICAAITEIACQAGMKINRPSELSMDADPRAMAELLADQFIAAKVNGVFFTPVEGIPDQEAFNLDIIEHLIHSGIQVVLLDRDILPWPRQSAYDLVGIDNIVAGYTMSSHLIENKCSRLAFVSAPNPAQTVQLRRIGAHEALVQDGQLARKLLDVEFLPEHPEKTAHQLLEQKVNGIICANDATAAPLLRALLDLGADIPGTAQVCGFDDVKYASLLSVPLTSFHQPCSDIGRIAAITMINRIKYPDSPARRITLKGDLIVRHSSRGLLAE